MPPSVTSKVQRLSAQISRGKAPSSRRYGRAAIEAAADVPVRHDSVDAPTNDMQPDDEPEGDDFAKGHDAL